MIVVFSRTELAKIEDILDTIDLHWQVAMHIPEVIFNLGNVI